MPLLHVSKNDSLYLSRPLTRGVTVASAVLLAVALAACSKGDAPPGAGGHGGPGGGAAHAPEVGVVIAKPGEVGVVTELPGRLESSRIAQVRARAAGIVQERLFREGSDVKAGQPLFRIDPAPYTAAMNNAQAGLARAEANAVQAKALADRYKPLVEANAVSKQDYANAVAAHKAADAEVASARAAVDTAKINLGYANVTSPISGRIGRALVTEGALVGQGDATELAVVQQINPLYVNFTQSANEALKMRQAMDAGQYQRVSGANAAVVKVVMEDGKEYPLPGKLLFSDLSVDPSSGQVTLRAEVPNPKGELLPGLYVRVRIEQAQMTDAIAVPQQAVTRTQQGDTLTVVHPDGKMEQRHVKVGLAQNNQWIVLEGLKAGEQVMVDGFMKLMMLPPGTPVKAVPWKPVAAGAAPAGAAAGGAAPAGKAEAPAPAASAPDAAKKPAAEAPKQ